MNAFALLSDQHALTYHANVWVSGFDSLHDATAGCHRLYVICEYLGECTKRVLHKSFLNGAHSLMLRLILLMRTYHKFTPESKIARWLGCALSNVSMFLAELFVEIQHKGCREKKDLQLDVLKHLFETNHEIMRTRRRLYNINRGNEE